MVVVRTEGVRCRAGLRLDLCRTLAAQSMFFVQVGQDVGGFCQYEIIILQDGNIILARNIEDLRTHPANVWHDDIRVGKSEVR